uniref:Myosin light chain kinase, smooth muscle-like n=1 Tax=Crocodylus porosus TaxID=8502 RepID=A0A7M4FAQ4_CROPO
MNLLHHPRLVQCLAAFQSRAELVMVMEYIVGGELFERILDDDFEHTEPTSVQYMRQILEGIQYVHHQSIVHLDLKPENIVCVSRSSHWVKIIDFGLARKLGGPVKVLHGTPEFMAPEVVSFEPVGFTTDMWSIGVICYILLSGDSPFQGSSDMETLNNITAARWEFDEETFSEISEQAKEFISQLLQKDSRCRLSSDKALAHPWLKQIAPSATKTLSKERMKQFLARQKWQLDHSQEKGEVFALQKLQIKQEPHFLESLQDLVEVEGSSACLQCHIESFPDPEVTWLQGDVPIQESPHLHVAYEENGSCSLTILELTAEDAGQYVCRAVNDVGEAECSARLTVCPQQKVTEV